MTLIRRILRALFRPSRKYDCRHCGSFRTLPRQFPKTPGYYSCCECGHEFDSWQPSPWSDRTRHFEP